MSEKENYNPALSYSDSCFSGCSMLRSSTSERRRAIRRKIRLNTDPNGKDTDGIVRDLEEVRQMRVNR